MIDRAFIRELDWSRTPLGRYESWPHSLKGYVSMIVELPTPAILFWGPELIQIYNEAYTPIMGPRHPRYFGAPFRECWPETFDELHPWIEDVLTRGESQAVEDALFVVTRHGRPEHAYFTFSFSPLRDDDGAIAGIFQPVLEVTERVIGRRRLALLRALASHPLGKGHAISDAARVIATASADIPFSLTYLPHPGTGALEVAARTGLPETTPEGAWLEQLGATARQVYERGVAIAIDGLSPPSPAGSAYALPIRCEGERALGVLVLGASRHLRFDDAYRTFFESIAGQVAANERAAAALRAEEELLERERAVRREVELRKDHLAALFHQAPTPITVLRGPDLVVELANPPTCELLGRSHDQVIGRPLFDVLPELRGQVYEDLLTRVYQSGVPYVGESMPVHIAHCDGTVRDVDLSFVYSPLRAASGEVDGVMVIAFDVTTQVRAHEELENLRAAAEAASAAKDEFLAMLGHELRNPLAPILTAVELVRRGPGDAELMLDVIERQARHLVRLVGGLLDVSRMKHGKIELQRERIDIGTVVRDATEMTAPLLEQRRHELAISVEPDLVVEGDRARLAQIFSNLLINAAKFTAPRGRVEVDARRAGDSIQIVVRDSGIGIESELLPQIFDVFVEARQGRERTQGGLGLGLAIVRRLVALHGGEVSARSEGRDRGSELVVRLPAAPPQRVVCAAPPSSAPAPTVVDPCERRRILVVDDNEDAAELLGTWLEALGHTVRIAHDGAEALREAAAFEPDVALLDIGLPVIDGHELARRLRADTQLHATRLVALTGYGQETDHERSRAAGFDAHLVKPVDLEPLGTLITHLTARSSSRSAAPPAGHPKRPASERPDGAGGASG